MGSEEVRFYKRNLLVGCNWVNCYLMDLVYTGGLDFGYKRTDVITKTVKFAETRMRVIEPCESSTNKH